MSGSIPVNPYRADPEFDIPKQPPFWKTHKTIIKKWCIIVSVFGISLGSSTGIAYSIHKNGTIIRPDECKDSVTAIPYNGYKHDVQCDSDAVVSLDNTKKDESFVICKCRH